MALAAGTKVGPYEVVSFIGAGGMGEVYKARDTRLQRDVALKLLPTSFAADADRLRRFEQEARAVAALSHPNILAVHDIGQYEGSPFLVSELLEGESLHDALLRGPLSTRRATDYAVQVAHGLAAAHGKNIAHRDLKPDNIYITREGRVKILDFGLAKTVEKPAAHANAGATMTAAGPATEVGTVVGTAGYMSPEQVRGATVDCRTDIFSFGAVLYEMLTGQRAFKRDTKAETMAAILNDDPPELLESGRQIPPALDRIVRHCLEKAPEQRFQSARDLAFDLESLSSMTSSTAITAAKAKARRGWWYLAAAVALAAMVAIVWMMVAARQPVTGPQFHQLTYRRGNPTIARFSPDGQNVIYTAAWESSQPEIYTVPVNGTGGHPLGIKNARLLSVSKSGELAVALAPKEITSLLVPGMLARTSDVSGAPKPEIENIQDADFTPDGSELAIVRYVPSGGFCQVEYPIGKVLFRNGGVDSLRFSPDGKYLAFISHDNPSDDRGNVVILRKNGEKVAVGPVYESAQGLAWSPSGKEVWTTSPLESGEVHAMNLAGKVRQPLAVPGRLFLQDISRDGKLVASQGVARRGMVVGHKDSQQDISWLDFGYLRYLTPDGKTVLFEEEGNESKNYTVFVRDVDGSPAVPIGEGYAETLSSDKRWAVGAKLAPPETWLLPVGPGEARRLSPPNLVSICCGAAFIDGDRKVIYMAFEKNRSVTTTRSWIQDLNGGAPRPITPEGIVGGMVSPDGKWLLAGGFTAGNFGSMVPIDGGTTLKISGLKPKEVVLGWTSDNQVYVMQAGENCAYCSGTNGIAHIEKLNPRTGARVPWRDLPLPSITGVRVEFPLITPDGSTYAFGYRLRLWDLYTINGVH